MSYAVTDAVEEDMRKELKVVEKLNEDIDQLSSEARDCDYLCPEVKNLLDLAWWFTESAIRETSGRCSAGCSGDSKKFCACCSHYRELTPRAQSIKGRVR